MTPKNHPAKPWSLSDEARQAVVVIYQANRPEATEQDGLMAYRAQRAAEIWGGPVVDLAETSFLGVVGAEAHWAREEIAALNDEPDRKTGRKELADLHKHLARAVASLNGLSLSARRLLPIEFDPIEAAAELERFAASIGRGRCELEKSPPKMHLAERQEAIAREFALRLLRAARDFGIKPAATFETVDGVPLYASAAVQMLHLLGRDIGLPLNAHTWKRHIAEAFRTQPE